MATKETKEVPVDSVLNQPISDFMPKGVGDKHAAAVELQTEALSFHTGNAAVVMAEQLVEAAEMQEQAKKDAVNTAKVIEQTTKEMFEAIGNVPPDLYEARERARVQAQAAMITTSTTVPGGRYKVNGTWVNCNGDVLEDQKG